MCFEKAAKRLSLSSGLFPLADDFHNFASFFIWQVKGSQILREIKLVPWSGTMPWKVKQLHFPYRHACPSSFCRERCLDLLKLTRGAHTNWLLEISCPAGSCWAAGIALGLLTHFSLRDWMAHYLKGRRTEPTQFAPTCCEWPGKGAASPVLLWTLKKYFAPQHNKQPGKLAWCLVPLRLEVREGHDDKLGYSIGQTTNEFITPPQDPHPAHFPEARSSGRGKKCGAKNHSPSIVVIHTLIFIYRALYAANWSRHIYWASITNIFCGLTSIPTRGMSCSEGGGEV